MRKKLFSKYLINQKGYSLLITIFALALISVIALSATAFANNTLKISDKERITQPSYYIAEAGLVEKKAKFVDLVETAYADTLVQQAVYYLTNSTPFDFETKFKENVVIAITGFLGTDETFTYEKNLEEEAEAIVKIENSPLPDSDYRITSTGKIGSSVETVVYQDYKIGLLAPVSGTKDIVTSTGTGTGNPSEMIPPEKGVYALGPVKATGSVELNTIIYSLPTNKNRDQVHHHYKDKVVYGEEFNFKLPPFPDTAPPQGTEKKSISGTSISLDKDIEITSLPNGKITINVGSDDRNIYLDASVYKGHEIEIIGTGKVSIFISKASSGAASIDPNITYGGTADKLAVYLDKGVKLGRKLNVDGSLYAVDSGFATQGGSVVRGTLYLGGDSSGAVITGNGDIIGNIFSPNNTVEIKGTPNIYGSIVSKDLVLGGNMTLNSGQGKVPHIPVGGTTTTTVQEIIGSDARFEASNVKVK